jgi:glyoxylase-like metal-dependent hydrolase (beta-lactamase superfamily II)
VAPHQTGLPREIAPGVHCLEVGKGLMRSNIYFVRSGPSWALIDAGSANCGLAIQEAAESLFGKHSPAASILLTHDHPDHAGSARELAKLWNCPVWVHPDELPLAVGGLPTFGVYANPLDRWVILPLLRLMGSRRTAAMLARASLRDVARPLDAPAELPGLPDWEAIPTPGHTPGHVAFFRRGDRVLITGDALVTLDLNSWSGLLLKKRKVSGPPRYTTWSWRAAKASVASLARLEPRVVAGGHGIPMDGPKIAEKVRLLSERMGGASG